MQRPAACAEAGSFGPAVSETRDPARWSCSATLPEEMIYRKHRGRREQVGLTAHSLPYAFASSASFHSFYLQSLSFLKLILNVPSSLAHRELALALPESCRYFQKRVHHTGEGLPWQARRSSTEGHFCPPSGYQTPEILHPKELGLLQESHDGERKRPKPWFRPEKNLPPTMISHSADTLQDRSETLVNGWTVVARAIPRPGMLSYAYLLPVV